MSALPVRLRSRRLHPVIASLLSERGSGSILAVSILATVIAVTSLTLPLYTVLRARLQAQGAADSAALAAAAAAVGIVPGVPCERAEALAVANGTQLTGCELDGLVVTVQVRIGVFSEAVQAMATAGPPDP